MPDKNIQQVKFRFAGLILDSCIFLKKRIKYSYIHKNVCVLINGKTLLSIQINILINGKSLVHKQICILINRKVWLHTQIFILKR